MTDQKWPGYGQDGEAARLEQERQRAEQIKADNLSARIRAADPAQRTAIDPATGRTFADAVARGLYDDDARTRQFRETAERNRQARAEVQRDIDRRAGRWRRSAVAACRPWPAISVTGPLVSLAGRSRPGRSLTAAGRWAARTR